VVLAIARNVKGFQMPGTGIPDFARHSKAIADAGIYDFAAHHDHILQPIVVKHWGLEHLEGLSPEAEEARVATLSFITRVGKAGRRSAERRAARTAKDTSRQPVPA
jgi:acyl-[acyl-carrier-protein] desaturase